MKLKQNKTYVIAEIGINHEGSLNNAIKLIRAAKNSGADAMPMKPIICFFLAAVTAFKLL